MVVMALKARRSERSGFEPRFWQRPKEDDKKSSDPPLGMEITVERPPSDCSSFLKEANGEGKRENDVTLGQKELLI
jgi:hypothetical protein